MNIPAADGDMDLVKLTVDQILADIREYQGVLDAIPLNTGDPDELIAQAIFNALLQERRAILARLQPKDAAIETEAA